MGGDRPRPRARAAHQARHRARPRPSGRRRVAARGDGGKLTVTRRPGLRAVLDYAREGDVIVVHTLDRLGGTVRDTLNLIHALFRTRGRDP
ncbi:MAG: recombinase family protein [Solirubrobacterales bacterium]|nr:recombinase family protein [Solirubrobacterales bacterium]